VSFAVKIRFCLYGARVRAFCAKPALILYKEIRAGRVKKNHWSMRKFFSTALAVVAVGFVCVGCAGPEQKLGRGVSNLTEFARLGELRRSVEQTAVWESPERGYTTGFIRGMNRSIARTAVGAFEVVTFPFPPYGPVFFPADPVYPDSYRPALLADPLFGQDAALGFSSGDVVPFVPGSRFRIFDY
jgi:putative exosortase-associated protein (TIGR04073 family)